jgi:3-hydroxyisobutyrate dehydrogenase/2-hydroxy-3-oxopropionate reductase
MSTVGPAAIRWLASAVPAGTPLLDAPVLGSLAEAESGTLRLFVGGPTELVERWRPVLAALGTVTRVGPLGAGAAAKLVANAALLGVLAVLGESLALADGFGLPRDAAFEVLAATPLATQAARRRDAVEAGSYTPRFPLCLARKDSDLVADAAAAAGVELRVAAAVRSWLADADRIGWGECDYTAVLAQILGAAAPPPQSAP